MGANVSDSLELIVGRIEGRLAGMEAKLDAALGVHSDTLKAHDVRLTAVERWQWRAAGVLALIAFVAPVIVKVLF